MVIFSASLLLKNISNNNSFIKNHYIFGSIDKYFFYPFGFFHRGWGMFPGPGTGASINRVAYFNKDGSVDYTYYFPRVASIVPSVWNEVMEDIMIRDDNGDAKGYIKRGYFQYNCHINKDKILKIEFQSSWVPLSTSFARIPIDNNNLSFKSDYIYNCKDSNTF
jgi:hypothetical protein